MAVRVVDDVSRDIGYALRIFRSQPGFTAVAVLTLALGVGANTAIFSVVHAVLLQPLPYKDADRLVRLVEHIPAAESARGQPERVASMAIHEFDDWRAQSRTLSHMALYATSSMTLMGRDPAIRLRVARVSPATFPMLGLQPAIGRAFTAAEDTRGADPVAILGTAAWTRHFSADPAIIGRPITLDERVYTVIGVLGPDAVFPERDTDVWVPFVPLDPQTGRLIRAPLIARLQDGVSREAATEEANALAPRLRGAPRSASRSSDRAAADAKRFEILGVQTHLVAPVRTALMVLMLAVGGVLLIACANVANLLLARNVSRQRELAIRGALGARHGRLIRQVLTESLVLACLGGVAGLAFAFGGVQVVKTLARVEGPRWLAGGNGSGSILPSVDRIGIDATVLTFTLSAAILTGILFGLAPVLHLRHVRHIDLIKTGSGAGATASGASQFSLHRGRGLLVVAQLALATMLLVGAGLLIRSVVKLSHVDAGYDARHVLTFQVVMPSRRLAVDDLHRQHVAEEITQRIKALPGVRFAGFTNLMPLTGGARWMLMLSLPGVPPESMRQNQPQTRYVSQAYLQAMGVRLVEGRWFSKEDATGAAKVLLVNEAFAKRFFPGRSAVRTLASLNGEPWEIIGVVGDVRQGTLDTEAEPQWFIDFRQLPSKAPFFPNDGGVFFAVRTDGDGDDGDPLAAVTAIRGVVRQLEPRAALDNVYEMEHLVSSSLARPRFYAVLLGIFASVAAALAAIGIYGVLAYSVTQRTREIGIRMALGAPRSQVLALVLRQSAVLILSGIVIGIAGALALTRYLTSMLFGLTPLDPPTFVGVSLAFAAIATIASYVPARRAATVDPVVALRSE
jgi:predicted permease